MADDPKISFMLSLAADAHEFFRWQCPRCGLDFKLKVDADATQDVLAAWAHRYLSSEGVYEEREADCPTAPTRTSCPYCGTTSKRDDFLHPEVVQYIKHFAFREVVEPRVMAMFRDFASSIRSSKYLTVKTSFSEARACRPLSGPEPDDQVIVHCLACQKLFKVDESWRGDVTCPACNNALLCQ